ncbi:MAG: type II toxin-antitoxin system VapB family antitoxin [Candidatus Electrothrix sp. YB6]
MPMTVNIDSIDSALFEEARTLTGIKEKATLLRQALQALIERESRRRLADLGGSEPELQDIPRRRMEE